MPMTDAVDLPSAGRSSGTPERWDAEVDDDDRVVVVGPPERDGLADVLEQLAGTSVSELKGHVADGARWRRRSGW
jgi:hypothetical protein